MRSPLDYADNMIIVQKRTSAIVLTVIAVVVIDGSRHPPVWGPNYAINQFLAAKLGAGLCTDQHESTFELTFERRFDLHDTLALYSKI